MRDILLFLFFLPVTGFAQYAPPAGQPGSTAVHRDSSIIRSWAYNCRVFRGPADISQPGNGTATSGTEASGQGKADNMTVSLGDGGYAVYKIDPPMKNGVGFDFVVFENGFHENGSEFDFLELAFTEVSSDSIHFIRFPSVSFTQTASQTGTFGLTDARKINNLAGKYIGPYGTPFDIEDIKDSPFLQADSIRFVKIIDVVGNINAPYASHDSQGNIINDPWPTAFPVSGFDLDALGIISQNTNNVSFQQMDDDIRVYPVPAGDRLHISFPGSTRHIVLQNISGAPVRDFNNKTSGVLDFSGICPGLYFLFIESDHGHAVKKILKL